MTLRNITLYYNAVFGINAGPTITFYFVGVLAIQILYLLYFGSSTYCAVRVTTSWHTIIISSSLYYIIISRITHYYIYVQCVHIKTFDPQPHIEMMSYRAFKILGFAMTAASMI